MVSLSVDYPFACEPLKEQVDSSRVIGLDYSQKELYADSEAENAQYPRFHKLIKKRQRRLNKSLARKRGRAEVDEQGNPIYSKRYQRTLQLYQRRDSLHKLSAQITNVHDAIVVEDLDLRNLAHCLSLGKKLHEQGLLA